MRRIHPAFKQFILRNAVPKWDSIIKGTLGEKYGIDSGVCFSTSNAFCQIFDQNLGIPCKIEMVETTIGNKHSKDLFDHYVREGDVHAFWMHLEHVNQTKGKENLTPDDPVAIGMGMGGGEDQFHFIMNLPEQNEMVDLTLAHIKRPKWGISCENYWAKYERGAYKHDVFYGKGNEVWRRSGCVLATVKKKTPGKITMFPEIHEKQVRHLRRHMYHELKKRKIPIFLER
jgi:hypothetical protein